MSVTVQPKGTASKLVKRGLVVGAGIGVAAFIGGVMSAQNVVYHVEATDGGFSPDGVPDGDTSENDDEEAKAKASAEAFQKSVLNAVKQHMDANEAAKDKKRKERKSYLDRANDSLAEVLFDYLGDKLAPATDNESLIGPLIQQAKKWTRDRVFDIGFYCAAVVMTVRDAGRASYREFMGDLAYELEKSLSGAVDDSPQPGDVVGTDGVFMSGFYDHNGRAINSTDPSDN